MMPTVKRNRFLLLYGSQTGQAQAIAEEIAEKAGDQGLFAELRCLGTTEKKFFLEREKCVVIVTSTTGDGEPPDTAVKFYRRLHKKTLPGNHLSHLNYALLGLGDSNYTNFCNCGKSLDRRLLQLGARHFYTPGWADDAVGLEVVVEPWIDGLWAAIRDFQGLPQSDIINTEHVSVQPVTLNGSGDKGEVGESVEKTVSPVEQSGPGVRSGISGPDKADVNVTDVPNAGGDNCIDPGKSPSEVIYSNMDSKGDASVRTIAGESPEKTEAAGNTNNSGNEISEEQVSESRTSSAEALVTSAMKSFSQDSKSEPNKNSSEQLVSDGCTGTTNAVTAIDNSLPQTSDAAGTCDLSSSPVAMEASLRHSVPPLSESPLTVPLLSPAYLQLEFTPQETQERREEACLQNGHPFPSAASPVSMATITSVDVLTADTAVKRTLSFKLDVTGSDIQYQPGDSISVICPNEPNEVQQLLHRLGVAEMADSVYKLTILSDTKKRNPSLPKFVPESSTLRQVFSSCLDIRESPKKGLLRVLVEHTADGSEKRRLQELCSKQGNEDYSHYVREASVSLLDVLNTFPSCTPPVSRLIEHLPRLQPRPYSICSCPLSSPGGVEFVFNVINIPAERGRTCHRQGLCTGWLNKKTRHIQRPSFDIICGGDACEKLRKLSIKDSHIQVPIFARTSQRFHLPEDPTVPVIMVGPGTGVAVFMGFLRHRQALRTRSPDTEWGESWLFYGCRNKEKDFLFRQEMEQHHSSGNLTRLCVSFSRDTAETGSPKYVQDNIRNHSQQLVKLLDDTEAVIYVCGDAKNMAKDVNQAFIDIFATVRGIEVSEASKVVMELRLKRRYLEDVWT